MSLRNFSTLTKGDIIEISYNSQIYEIAVLETKAHRTSDDVTAICVIETNMKSISLHRWDTWNRNNERPLIILLLDLLLV